MYGGGKKHKGQRISLIYHKWHWCIQTGTRARQYTQVKTSQRQQACTESMFSVPVSFGEKDREKRSKESWLTLGPVIKKLFTDLEKETAYSLREAQCPSQIPLLTSLISALCNMLNCDTSRHPNLN